MDVGWIDGARILSRAGDVVVDGVVHHGIFFVLFCVVLTGKRARRRDIRGLVQSFKLGIKCKNANSVQVTSPQAPNKSYRSTSMPKDVNVVSDAKLVIRRRPFCRSRRPSSSRGTRRTSRQCVADCAQNLTQAITMARMRRIGSTVLLVSSQIPFCRPLPAVDEST